MEFHTVNLRSDSSSGATTSTHPTRRVWSRNEDEDLKKATAKYSPASTTSPSWAIISTEVGNGDRSTKDCRKRWYHTLDPGLKKGRWTRTEDQLLRDAFVCLGPQWTALASHVPGRNDEQVAKRWKDVLAPELDLTAPWTRAEDELLLKLHRVHGPKWTLISDAFPKRNGIACRNRHRKWSKLSQDTGQGSELTSSPVGIKSDAVSAFDGRDELVPSDATDGSLPDLLDETDEEQHAFSQMLQSFIVESQAGERHRAGMESDPGLGLAHISGSDLSPTRATQHPPMDTNLWLESWLQDLNRTPPHLLEPSCSYASAFATNNESSATGLASVHTSSIDGGLEPMLPQTAKPPLMDTNFSLESWFQGLNKTPHHVQEPSCSDPSSSAINNASSGPELASIGTSPNLGNLEPIRNAWALFTALENDRGDSLLVSKDLIRKLIADASAK